MLTLTRAAAAVALAAVMAAPTNSMAAPLDGGFSYSGPAVVENAAWHGGRWHGGRRPGGRWHGGNWHGGNWHGPRGGRWGWGGWGGAPLLGLGAGLFGFGLGTAIARDRYYNYGNYYNYGPGYGYGYAGDDHVARCAATYRSYNVRTDSFLGYDGYWHRCRL